MVAVLHGWKGGQRARFSYVAGNSKSLKGGLHFRSQYSIEQPSEVVTLLPIGNIPSTALRQRCVTVAEYRGLGRPDHPAWRARRDARSRVVPDYQSGAVTAPLDPVSDRRTIKARTRIDNALAITFAISALTECRKGAPTPPGRRPPPVGLPRC